MPFSNGVLNEPSATVTRSLRGAWGRACALIAATPDQLVLGTHELGTQRASEPLVRPGMTFYDVGANVGFYCVIVGRLAGSAGHIVAFEPLDSNLLWIEHNARLNDFANVEARRETLGDKNGAASLLVSASSGWGKLAGVGAPPSRMVGDVTVRLRRLDTLVRDSTIPCARPDKSRYRRRRNGLSKRWRQHSTPLAADSNS